jgi:flagellar biosynthesis/type III secretory pathway M-ring protein FliF/YscJ
MFGGWDEGLWAIVPTIAVLLLFWFVMRAIIRADRTERAAQAKYEAEADARALAGAQDRHADDPGAGSMPLDGSSGRPSR